jgi:hypothetical protein
LHGSREFPSFSSGRTDSIALCAWPGFEEEEEHEAEPSLLLAAEIPILANLPVDAKFRLDRRAPLLLSH